MRRNTACIISSFHCQWDKQTQKICHAPSGLGASLRSRLRVSLRSLATPWLAGPWGFASSLATPSQAPLSVGLRCVASLRRSGLHFLFVLYRWLRGYAAPPPATVFRPLRGSNLGSLTLANSPPTSHLSDTDDLLEVSLKKFFHVVQFITTSYLISRRYRRIIRATA